ncbi:Nuclear pore protein [Plasmodiophora brassicae]
MAAAMDYQKLVLESEALLADLPADLQQRAGCQLVRSLPQLQAESSRFAGRQTKRSFAESGQALAVSGLDRFDLSKEKRALDKIDLSSAYEDFEPTADQNLDRYLDYQHSLLVNALIEENNNKIMQEFRDNYNARMWQDWQKQKNLLLRNLAMNFADSSPTRKAVAAPLPEEARGSAYQAHALAPSVTKQAVYSEAVVDVLNKRGHVAEMFARAAARVSEHTASKDTSVPEVWKLVEEFAYATSQHRSVPAPYPVLLHASIRFLEVQFRDWVSEHLGKARIGGTPGIANHLRAFIREIVFRQRYPSFMKQDVMIDNVPLWVQLFYCLRCGARNEAVEIVSQASRMHPENAQLALLASCMASERLTQDQVSALSIDYNSFVRDEADPFAVTVYNVVARGAFESYDTMKYRQNQEYRALFRRYIAPTHTDYLWFTLSLLDHNDVLENLKHFQATIRGYEQHFSRNQTDPVLYFLVLLLSLQFATAVQYLLSSSVYRVDAVHFAVSVDQLGLLLPRTVAEARSELDEVDIEAVLREYLLDPSAPVPPASAVRYLALIAETHPESFDALFVELLVGHLPPLEQIETISTLVNKEAGIAREYVPSDRIDRLCLVAADRACRDEAFLVANELYAIAEPQPQERYAQTLIRLLDRHLSAISSPIRQLAMSRAQPVLGRPELSSRVRDGLEALYQLAAFFNANHGIRFDEALNLVCFSSESGVTFVPLAPTDIQPAMTRFGYLNSVTGGVLARSFPEVATIIMKILFNKYQMVRSAEQDPSRFQSQAAVLRDLREQAQALHSFYIKLESTGVVASYAEPFSKFYRTICQ